MATQSDQSRRTKERVSYLRENSGACLGGRFNFQFIFYAVDLESHPILSYLSPLHSNNRLSLNRILPSFRIFVSLLPSFLSTHTNPITKHPIPLKSENERRRFCQA